MKPLLVNTYHFPGGGDSTYTFDLADLLRSHGYDVSFFAMKDERNVPDPNSDLFVSDIDFRDLNAQKTLANGVKVLTRSFYSQEARHKFRQLLRRERPDVVHLQNIHAHITPSIILEARAQGIPVVWTLHDYKLICPNSHFYIDTSGDICEACSRNSYYQAMLRRCKKGSFLASSMAALEAYVHRYLRVRQKVTTFIAPSLFLRHKLAEHGFPLYSVEYIPHFVSKNFFHRSDLYGEYFLFFGKISTIKGIFTLLNACTLLKDINVICAGRIDENIEEKFFSMLPATVKYVGVKYGEELRELVRNSCAVLVPSLWYENQPFSILEAFACSKPVIAADIGGMPELVKPGERGLLVPGGDVEGLAQAMEWMWMNPIKVREMGENAYNYAFTNHHPEVHYEKIMAIYGKALK